MPLTRIFFKATNTLGADTTAILVSDVAPARRCLARSVAHSSEYWYGGMIVSKDSQIHTLSVSLSWTS